MGSAASHLHMFNTGGATYGVPDLDDEMELHDERKIALNRPLSVPKQKLIYEFATSATRFHASCTSTEAA